MQGEVDLLDRSLHGVEQAPRQRRTGCRDGSTAQQHDRDRRRDQGQDNAVARPRARDGRHLKQSSEVCARNVVRDLHGERFARGSSRLEQWLQPLAGRDPRDDPSHDRSVGRQPVDKGVQGCIQGVVRARVSQWSPLALPSAPPLPRGTVPQGPW